MELPVTRYHPDPVGTGSVEEKPDQPCLCCNRICGYVYTGPAYSEKFHYLSGCICIWCVADGSAAKQFGAEFTDTDALAELSEAIVSEVATRTPGFVAWQQERWLTCCKDAAAYLGRAGAAELKGKFAGALPALKAWIEEEYGLKGRDLDAFVAELDKDAGAIAYVFRCLHCAKYLAYTDEL